MQNIHFPKASFRTAIRGYTREDGHGLDACLWRELLQNARDAGATRVDCSLTRDGDTIVLTFRDNGKGMSWDTLQAGMLTYAGSVKETGSAGGFGMAKNVLCFASDSTTIRTLDSAVRIEGIQYEVLPVEVPLQGTEIVIRCPQGEQPDLRLEPTQEGLSFLLARCDLRGLKVYLDGALVPDCRHEITPEDVVHTFDFGGRAAYWKRRQPFLNAHGAPVAALTHRGIWVCDLALPSDVPGCLLIDVEVDAKSVLNDTRTNLSSYWQRSDLERWIGKLNQGAHSTLKTKKFVKRFDGGLFLANVAEVADRVARTLGEGARLGGGKGLCLDEQDAGALLNAVADKIAQTPASVQRLDPLPVTVADAKERLAQVDAQDQAQAVRQLLWTPALMVVNEREGAVPKHYLPETMSPRVKQVLRVWTELTRQFLIWQGEYRPFGVGFIFSDDTRAAFREETDGSIWFLINPVDSEGKLAYGFSREEDRSSMIVSAGHEAAHAAIGDQSIHGDGFVVAFGQNMRLALTHATILNRIWRTSR